MRVLVIADEVFATRERSMLTRLEVGLADEGIRVARALPERVGTDGAPSTLGPPIVFEDTRLPFTRSVRAARLAADVERVVWSEAEAGLPNAGGRAIDVVHAFGGGVWDLALEVARRLDAALAVEVWRLGLADRAPWAQRRAQGVPHVFLAPDPAIERRMKAQGLSNVRVAPWGVYAQSRSRAAATPGRSVGIVITGGGRDPRATLAAIEGVALAVRDQPDSIVFMDGAAAARARVWPHAKRVGLLERLSLIDDLEHRRELALRADILVQPEAMGEQRSLLLDAMASGMVVIAAADPGVSWLVDGQTSWLVPEPSPRLWAEAVTRAISKPDDARGLTESAMSAVARDHRASAHVSSVLAAYEWVAGGPKARVIVP